MHITELFLKLALLGAEWVMYLLIGCSVLSVTIIIERIFYFARFRGDFAEFIKELTDRLNGNESPQIVSAWCSGQKMLEAQVAAVGLERATSTLRSVEESMNATLIGARTRLDRGLTILGTLGSNTPFIGLFGTVIGVIQAFHALATNKSAGPEVVMASISEALVATAIGILVAVPATVAYNILLRSIRKKMANAETVARVVLTHLGAAPDGAARSDSAEV
jgi:biopolymer transport protein ExbB